MHLGGSWRRASMPELVKDATGLDVLTESEETLVAFCNKHELEIPQGSAKGKLIALIYEHLWKKS